MQGPPTPTFALRLVCGLPGLPVRKPLQLDPIPGTTKEEKYAVGKDAAVPERAAEGEGEGIAGMNMDNAPAAEGNTAVVEGKPVEQDGLAQGEAGPPEGQATDFPAQARPVRDGIQMIVDAEDRIRQKKDTGAKMETVEETLAYFQKRLEEPRCAASLFRRPCCKLAIVID